MMPAFGFAAMMRFQDDTDITVICTEPGNCDIRFEDILALRILGLTADEHVVAEGLMEEAAVAVLT